MQEIRERSNNKVVAYSLALVLIACWVSFADEPGWSPEERAKHSDLVFVGEVLTVERVAKLNDHEDLYRAVVQVEKATKNQRAMASGKIALYFEGPKNGQLGARCPTYARPVAKQRALFYVRFRKVGLEVRAFIEMGSDITALETVPKGR